MQKWNVHRDKNSLSDASQLRLRTLLSSEFVFFLFEPKIFFKSIARVQLRLTFAKFDTHMLLVMHPTALGVVYSVRTFRIVRAKEFERKKKMRVKGNSIKHSFVANVGKTLEFATERVLSTL